MTIDDEHTYSDRLPCPKCGHQPVVEMVDGDWIAYCPFDDFLEEATTQGAAIRRWDIVAGKEDEQP